MRNGRPERKRARDDDRPAAWRGYGKLLRLFRDRAGMTQQQLADAIGYSIEQVASVEQGRRPAKGRSPMPRRRHSTPVVPCGPCRKKWAARSYPRSSATSRCWSRRPSAASPTTRCWCRGCCRRRSTPARSCTATSRRSTTKRWTSTSAPVWLGSPCSLGGIHPSSSRSWWKSCPAPASWRKDRPQEATRSHRRAGPATQRRGSGAPFRTGGAQWTERPDGALGKQRPTALRKSSYSGPNGGDCVEVAVVPGTVHVRDSKAASSGPVLRVGRSGWAAFVALAAGGADQRS